MKTICEYQPKTLKRVYMCIYYNDKALKIYNDFLSKYLAS